MMVTIAIEINRMLRVTTFFFRLRTNYEYTLNVLRVFQHATDLLGGDVLHRTAHNRILATRELVDTLLFSSREHGVLLPPIGTVGCDGFVVVLTVRLARRAFCFVGLHVA